MASVAISIRRRGIIRFARRKFDLRLAFFGSMNLFYLPMESASLEERIVLFLFQASRRIEALFVTRGDVTRSWFAFRFRLRALNRDDIPRHDS